MNRPRYEIEAYSVVSNISYTVDYSRQFQAIKRLSAKGITQRPRVYISRMVLQIKKTERRGA